MNEKENFERELEKGCRIEKEFVIRMIRKELDILKIEFAPKEVFKDWDVCLKINENGKEVVKTYEIKSDDKSLETGNICFEYACNGRPSGIYRSKADYIVYQIGGEFYIKPRDELLINLNFVEKKSVVGGDGDRARMWLVKKEKINDLFNKM